MSNKSTPPRDRNRRQPSLPAAGDLCPGRRSSWPPCRPVADSVSRRTLDALEGQVVRAAEVLDRKAEAPMTRHLLRVHAGVLPEHLEAAARPAPELAGLAVVAAAGDLELAAMLAEMEEGVSFSRAVDELGIDRQPAAAALERFLTAVNLNAFNAGKGLADTDGDGVVDAMDDDVDGDGKPNWMDMDVDGDLVPNWDDADVDGDGLENLIDDDVDGDGKGNARDDDIDGDGVANGIDDDDDGDGLANDVDADRNGDGAKDNHERRRRRRRR